MKETHTYREISEMTPGRHEGPPALDKQTVLGRMIGDLPQTPWANIGISDWLPGDDSLPVAYSSYDSPFGEVLIANTPKGICYLGAADGEGGHVADDFAKRFGYADLRKEETALQKNALACLNGQTGNPLQLHLRGTPYQTEIWRRLLRIPFGRVISYATLAGRSGHSRAAGAANGQNPIFWIVPCHRVVYADGRFDRYFWGKDIKTKLLAWEFASSGD